MLKRGLKALMATSPGWALSRMLRPNGTLVVMYHRVGPNSESFPSLDLAAFRAQMQWLQSNCTVIAPDEIRAPRRPRSGSGRPYVLVTFDDGYRDYHDHAYPVLKELGIPAINFLATVFQDEPGRLLWGDVLHLAAFRAEPRRVKLAWPPHEEIDLATEHGRRRWIRAAKAHLKELPHGANLKVQDEILEGLGLRREDLSSARQMMTWDEVRAVRELTTLGGHSHTHPILARLDAAAAGAEIRTCRERIEAELGEAPRQFAYPNGRAHDFNDDTKAILHREGFEVAYCTEEGVNDGATDWLAVRRIPAFGEMPDFAWALASLTDQTGKY